MMRLSDAEEFRVNLGSPDLRYCAYANDGNKSACLRGLFGGRWLQDWAICGGWSWSFDPSQMGVLSHIEDGVGDAPASCALTPRLRAQ